MTTGKIPTVTKEQLKQIDASFIKTYGQSYKRMRKEDLAIMVANQSTNYKKIEEQAHKIADLGLMYHKRWKNLVKIVRAKK